MFPLADTAREKGSAVVTKLLIAINIVMFGWEVWLSLHSGDHGLAAFVDTHALVSQRIIHQPLQYQQWFTLLSHMFLHGGILHLLGNVWFLWIFGGNVEGRLGSPRFLFFYLLAGCAAAGAQVLAEPTSTIPMIGASGAISGVLGAFLVLFPTAFVWTLVPWIVPILPIPAVLFLVLWFVMQAYNGVGSLLGAPDVDAQVAWWAHAGGFMAGGAMILWAKHARWIRRR